MSDASRGTDGIPELAGAERLFDDEDGVRWRVFEQPFSVYDRRGRSLIFTSDAAVRRVRNYPPEWRVLSDTDLVALSWRS